MSKKINYKKIISISIILIGISLISYSFLVERVSFVFLNNPSIPDGVIKEDKKVNVSQIKEDRKTDVLTIKIEEQSVNAFFNTGDSLFNIMNNLKENGQLNFSGKNYSGLGFFIDEINGFKNGNKNNWIFYINNKKADIGISAYNPKSGDLIEWKYEKEY